MRVCEPVTFAPLVGWRIIADSAALDSAPWPAGSQVVRISPDDVFLIGAPEPAIPGDVHAIVTPVEPDLVVLGALTVKVRLTFHLAYSVVVP